MNITKRTLKTLWGIIISVVIISALSISMFFIFSPNKPTLTLEKAFQLMGYTVHGHFLSRLYDYNELENLIVQKKDMKEIRKMLGIPFAEKTEFDGAYIYAYVTQINLLVDIAPGYARGFLLTFDKEGILISCSIERDRTYAKQILSEITAEKMLYKGMSQKEIIQILGEPDFICRDDECINYLYSFDPAKITSVNANGEYNVAIDIYLKNGKLDSYKFVSFSSKNAMIPPRRRSCP